MKIVVTGGHTGLGLELTRRLLEKPAEVGIIVRSKSRLTDVPSEVRDRLTVWEADLASRDAVDAVAE
ncbi:MAG: SDR family NAD(P)-dependent oxidoreductase, partial [Myxococcota bacterium]